jgi:hypothetical protein
MDFSKFRTGDWLLIGGGLVVLIFGFVDWFTLSGFSGGANAFDFTLTGLIPWLLLVAAAVITFLLAGGLVKPGGTQWPLILLGATALGALLIVIRLLIGSDLGDHVSLGGTEDVSLDRSAGLWLSTIGAVAAVAGSFLNFQAGGGNVRDLTDMNKIRDAFKSPPPPA